MTSAGVSMGSCAVGLDVGTTKICAVVGSRENGRMRVVSVGQAPSRGLRKGIVVDMDLTAQSIGDALRNTEHALGVRIPSVVVGVAGGHIKGIDGHSAVSLRHGMVCGDDVDRLIDSASAAYVPVDREVLHIIPSCFTVDGHNGIRNPVGLSGERLEGRVHIVTGSITPVQNLIRCCETAGLSVSDIVLEPLASADAVLTSGEREKGVVLVDIGGGTTDIAMYKKGMLLHTAVLAIGGNHITNDIAVGLSIPVAEAEAIKREYGCAVRYATSENPHIAVNDARGKTQRVSGNDLVTIVQPRCEELMALVKKEIDISVQRTGGESAVPRFYSHVVLTGGTALLKGIDVVAESVTGFPVRIGRPYDLVNGTMVNSPAFATGVGLARYGLEKKTEHSGPLSQEHPIAEGIVTRMKNWFRETIKL